MLAATAPLPAVDTGLSAVTEVPSSLLQAATKSAVAMSVRIQRASD
jgi:hypothetical protein